MDAAVHGNHYGIGRHQDQEDTTPSDVSERPSVDDVESDTGSTGALETRSLKDHKGNRVPLRVKQSRYWKGICMLCYYESKVQLLPSRGQGATCSAECSCPKIQFGLKIIV